MYLAALEEVAGEAFEVFLAGKRAVEQVFGEEQQAMNDLRHTPINGVACGGCGRHRSTPQRRETEDAASEAVVGAVLAGSAYEDARQGFELEAVVHGQPLGGVGEGVDQSVKRLLLAMARFAQKRQRDELLGLFAE